MVRPGPEQIPEDATTFLRSLGGPVAIRVPGRDRSRCRVATTLLHGNEPSGFRAMHAWLRAGSTPAVDALLVVANVEAALTSPGFAHRFLEGHRDLNRCFLGPWDDSDGHLAREILDAIGAAAPEALIDLHNNSGHNPPYGVGVKPSPEALELVSLFARRFVFSQLTLGALMEAVSELPSATIEVGRGGEAVADAVALEGLTRFLEHEQVLGRPDRTDVQVLVTPMRVCLKPGTSLVVADQVRSGRGAADLMILSDLDRHNFERLAPGKVLGFVRGREWPVEVIDEQGRDRAREFLSLEDGVLRTRQPVIPIMITTDPAIATVDCLFYVVREAEPQPD